MTAARLLAYLLVAALALAGCASPGTPVSSERATPADRVTKRVTAAILGDPSGLNYTMNRTGAGGSPGTPELDSLLNGGLVITRNRDLQPQLAEAVPTVENGLWKVAPDGTMETSWRIRPDAKWHDGTPFTSGDLLFTATVAMDSELALYRYPAYDAIESVSASDERTVTIKWRQPYIEADTMFSAAALLPIPKHLLEPTYLENKARLGGLSYWTDAFVGTGPFKLREWAAGSHTILEASDQYVLGRPRIDEIEVKFIPDGNTLIANILAGEVDLSAGRGISFDQALQAAGQWRDGRVDVSSSGSWFAQYPQLMNPNPAVLADVRFRRALMHFTDRQQLADTFMYGMTTPADTLISPTAREYREIERNIARYEFDVRKGAQLVEGLGYARGADGLYRDASGQPLPVELRGGFDQLQQKLVLAIADDWRQAGVSSEPVIFPTQRNNDLEWRMTRPGFEMVRQGFDVSRFHSSQTPLPENGYRGNNRTRYRNADLDSAIDRYYVTIPWQPRMQALGQMVSHLSDQLIVMGVLYDAGAMLVANRLLNAGLEDGTANAHEWDVK